MMDATTLLDYIFATFWKDYKEYVEAEEKFSKCSPDERFSYFYNILKKKKCLPDLEVVPTKSARKSIYCRKEGDEAFCHKRFLEAVQWYTKSAALALPGSTELAAAFANRSAALYKLNSFTGALVDINRALHGSYPDNLRSQLETRKQNCIFKLTTTQHSISTYLTLVKGIAVSIDPKRGELVTMPSTFDFNNDIMDLNYEHKFKLPAENYPKPTILPYIRKPLKVKYNAQFGRHIVATENIKPGETLGMEKPFASALDLKFRFSHCANCYVKSEALIPCHTCSTLMFCSKECRDTAYNRYHRVECSILFIALHFDIRDDIWLAVRMLMIATKQGEELKTLMKHPIYKNPMNTDPSHIPTDFGTEDYLDVHHLEDNATETSFEENYTFGFTAALIIHILKYSEFFGSKKKVSTDLSNKECFAGKLLMKFLFVIKHNAFRITETLRDDSRKTKFITLGIGSSIYIFHSYFNHSCEENGTKCFHKDVIVSRSAQLLSAGEQIFLNYGVDFAKIPRKNRLEYLQDVYKFDCNCQACKFDWPLLKGTNAASIPKLKPNSIKSETLRVLINKTQELRNIPALSFERKHFDKLCNHMESYHKSVKRPWREYYECQEKLKEIHSSGANYYNMQYDPLLMVL